MFAPCAEASIPCAQPDLGLPADVLEDLGWCFQSPLEMAADLGRVAVGPGAFNQRPAGLGVPRFGHGAQSASLPRRICRRDQSQALHELSGVRKPAEVAEFGHRGGGHSAWHPTQGLQDRDHWGEAPRVHLVVECWLQTLKALRVCGDRAHLFLENDVWRRGGPAHLREPSEMVRVAGGPAGVAEIVPQPEGFEPECGGRERAAGLFACPTAIPYGVVFHGKEGFMTTTMPPQPPSTISIAQHLLAMMLGLAQTQVLCVAVPLGLADHLQDCLKCVEALAAATGTHPGTVLYPHLHGLVTGSELTDAGEWRAVRHGFLLPVQVVMAVYRGKLLKALDTAVHGAQLALPAELSLRQWKTLRNQVGRQNT